MAKVPAVAELVGVDAAVVREFVESGLVAGFSISDAAVAKRVHLRIVLVSVLALWLEAGCTPEEAARAPRYLILEEFRCRVREHGDLASARRLLGRRGKRRPR